MLTSEDLDLARELLAKMREITAPRESENIRAGELPIVMECSRTTSWKVTKDPTFPRPIVLSQKIRIWRRAEVLAWMEEHREPAAKSPAAAAARGARDLLTDQDAALAARRDGRTRREYRSKRPRAIP